MKRYETNYITGNSIFELLEKKNRSYSDYKLVNVLKITNSYVAIIEKAIYKMTV